MKNRRCAGANSVRCDNGPLSIGFHVRRRAAPRNDEESFFRTLLDDLLRLVVGLAVTTQRGWLRSGIERLQARRDLGVLALEQAVSGEVAFDQERAEALHVKHPHGLR